MAGKKYSIIESGGGKNIDFDRVKQLLTELMEAMNYNETAIKEVQNLQRETDVMRIANRIMPPRYTIPNNRTSNFLTDREKGIINCGEFDIFPYGKNARKNKDTKATYNLICSKNKTLRALTEYQRAVFNAVCSLWEEAARGGRECIITTKDIYRVVSGTDGHPNEKAELEIVNAMKLFYDIDYEHDITEELKARHIEDTKYAKIKGKFVPMIVMQVKIKGAPMASYGYKILDMPPLMKACKLSEDYKHGQILTFDRNLIAISGLSATEGNIILRDYLMRYINAKRHEKAKSFPITFSKVFAEVYQKQSASRTEKKRLRETIEKMLNHWLRYDFIDTFELEKRGQEITGIRVYF